MSSRWPLHPWVSRALLGTPGTIKEAGRVLVDLESKQPSSLRCLIIVLRDRKEGSLIMKWFLMGFITCRRRGWEGSEETRGGELSKVGTRDVKR